ncbi:hypothetical protein NKI36_04925 [Mesorhizobium caraganae]|uniref:Uncharacterized protein n=1 Tax=Mesorhizobium caraganae TaxID=483206 RepID=A0ABV1YUG4_9HYPH
MIARAAWAAVLSVTSIVDGHFAIAEEFAAKERAAVFLPLKEKENAVVISVENVRPLYPAINVEPGFHLSNHIERFALDRATEPDYLNGLFAPGRNGHSSSFRDFAVYPASNVNFGLILPSAGQQGDAKLSLYEDAEGGRLAVVLDNDPTPENFLFNSKRGADTRQVGLDLGFADLTSDLIGRTGFSGGVSTGLQSASDEPHGPSANGYADESGERCDPLCIRIGRRSIGFPEAGRLDWLFVPAGCLLFVLLSVFAIGRITKPRNGPNENQKRDGKPDN